jgi:twitching motility protein PilT
MGEEKLMADEVKSLVESKMNAQQIEQFNNGEEIDYSIGVPGLSRFRVNVFSQRGNIAAAYRRLPFDAPGLDDLNLPPAIVGLAEKRKGLVLITGATGSGKSTTMAALVKRLTEELEGHILTIEDPIEYLYPHSKAQVNQREVGVDTESFASGLKSALRQDPDVVVVGELRDPDSMGAAISIAETGHLVFATMHTNTAAGAVTRMVDAFPPNKQDVIRMNLSMSLLAVVAQQLIPSTDGGRALACEVLVATQAIRALIRENNIHQIPNYIKSGGKDGMILMDDSLQQLYKKGTISQDNLLRYAIEPGQMEQAAGGMPKQPNI